MARRPVWQALHEWFQPSNRKTTRSLHPLNPVAGTSDSGIPETDFDEELLDFLSADLDPVPADPGFRERLREELWDLVQAGVTSRPKDH